MQFLLSIFISFLFVICFSNSYCQRNPTIRRTIDSLEIVLSKSKEDTNKINVMMNIGTWYSRGAVPDKAITYHSKALELSLKLNYYPGIVESNFRLGVDNMGCLKYDVAIKHYKKCLKLLDPIKEKKRMAGVLMELSAAYDKSGDLNESIQYALLSVKFFEESGGYINMPASYNNLAIALRKQGDYLKALDFNLKALKAWENSKDRFELIYVCRFYFTRADIYRQLTEYDKSLEILYRGLALSDSLQLKSLSASYYNEIGVAYMMRDQYEEAMEFFSKAIEIAIQLDDKKIIANSHNNIASLLTLRENYTEALKVYKKVLEMNLFLKDSMAIIRSFNNIGNSYSRLGDYSTAHKHYQTGLKITQSINDIHGLILLYQSRGLSRSLEFEQIRHTNTNEKLLKEILFEGLKDHFAALQYSNKINNKLDEAHSKVGIGTAYAQLSSIETRGKSIEYSKLSIEYLNEGLDLANEINSRDLVKDAYSSLVMAYKGLKNYKAALKYNELYDKLKDSLMNKQVAKKLEDLRITNEINKTRIEEKLLQQAERTSLQFEFKRKHDSLQYHKNLSETELQRQILLSIQQEQSIQLHKASLDLSIKQKELTNLAYLKTKAELEAEQSRLLEKENALTISEQEKRINQAQLNLQKTALVLKEKQLQAEKSKKIMYAGGAGLMLLFFGAVFWNVKSKQKANSVLAAEKLRTEKANAAHKMVELELQSLRTQLNPHFMFNSLNAIQELILMEDNENSHIYLARFSDLLRMLLDNATVSFISLKKEIEFLNLYLSLEKLRIPDLEYRIEVDDDINSSATLIPNMMLQPYIENAIWHGLSHKKGSRELTIKATLREHAIIFSVEDNGVGRKKALELKSQYRKEHKSKGMELLSKRFNLLSREYGAEIQTSVIDLESNTGPQGTLVKIIVPISLSEKTKVALHDTHNYN